MGELVGAPMPLFNVHKYLVSVYYMRPLSRPGTQREQDRACPHRLTRSSVSKSDKYSLQSGPVNLPNLSSLLTYRYCKLRQLVQDTVTDTRVASDNSSYPASIPEHSQGSI